MIKSPLNRLRAIAGNRRIKPRFKPAPGPPLIASIAMLETDAGTIAGHVRDLSESGMSFFILDSLATRRGLLTKGAKCRVVLALPAGVIYLSGQLAWCQLPDAQRPDLGAVMAVQITEIKRDAKEHYLAYLGSLE